MYHGDRVVTTITEWFLIMATVWRREIVKLGERVLSWRLIVHGASTTAIDRSVNQSKVESVSSEDSRREKTEPWMQRELEIYFQSVKRLASMVGADPDSFSDSHVDSHVHHVQDALRYLLPTQLTARDARPSLKHPVKVFPERKEAAFDSDGRPLDPGFYTGAPAFNSVLFNIYLHSKVLQSQTEMSRHSRLPESVTGEPLPPPAAHWLKREVMSNILAEELSEVQYEEIIKRLSRLSLHPALSRSRGTQRLLQSFQSKSASQTSVSSLNRVQHDGPVQMVGRRKTSTAVVRLHPGSGRVMVNRRPFVEYFFRMEDRLQVLYPLVTTNSLGSYDIHVTVHGGGLTGQAGAIRLAVSKALVTVGKGGFEGSGLLNRDPRSVERKKPGQKKARKKFTWVKR